MLTISFNRKENHFVVDLDGEVITTRKMRIALDIVRGYCYRESPAWAQANDFDLRQTRNLPENPLT